MNINTVWKKLIKDLLDEVGTYSPRGSATKEILGYQTIIDMSNPFLDIPKRNLGKNFRSLGILTSFPVLYVTPLAMSSHREP